MTLRTRLHTIAHARRTAFTLPELLVVVTVTLILMSILVSATGIITNTISSAKAQGDFMGQERAVLAVLRRDLQRDHFLDEDSKPNLGRKVSDQRTDNAVVSGTTIAGYMPPKSGYFWASSRPAVSALPSTWNINNDATWNFDEGTDGDGFQSSRSGNHFLQFTILLPGGAPEDTIVADVPYANSPATTAYPISGTCAEVAYFLVPNGATPNGIAKYKLIRRSRLAARTDDDKPAYSALLAAPPPAPPATVPTPVPTADSSEVMAVNSGTTLLNLADLAQLKNRIGGGDPTSPARQPIGTYRIGEDVLHHHVTSFEVKFTGTAASGITWPTPFASGNTDYPYDTLPFDGQFDTADASVLGATNGLASSSNPNGRIKPIRITGVQIRLRCWNPSTKTTRQSTLAVGL